MLNNIGGNISSLGEKAGGGLGNVAGGLGNLGSKMPGGLNPTNFANQFTGGAAAAPGGAEVDCSVVKHDSILFLLFSLSVSCYRFTFAGRAYFDIVIEFGRCTNFNGFPLHSDFQFCFVSGTSVLFLITRI